MQHTTSRQQIELARNAAIALFGQDLSNAAIARRLGVSRSTVSIWHNAYRDGGAAALALKKPGPQAKVSPEQLDQVRDAVLDGPAAHGFETELWTLDRIADLIDNMTGVRYHPAHVWELLGRMGLTCQKPECQAKERDAKAVQRWVTQEWPEIKKGR